MTELKIGTQGSEVLKFYDYFTKWATSYSFLLGTRDGYYGNNEAAFTKELQRRLGLPITGVFGDAEAVRTGYKFSSAPPMKRRKIWIYTSPGSGASWDIGPSFELGRLCADILKLNHQPVSFQKGGYLGLLGGDSRFSYLDVIWDQCKSIEWLLDNNPDVREAYTQARVEAEKLMPGVEINSLSDSTLAQIASKLEFETHFSGYSQSADGVEEALEYLFGDPGYVHPGDKTSTLSSGKYRLLRHCVKLVVQFGNPSTKGTGIARKTRSDWLDKKVRNVNKADDFYAKVPSGDKIRPAFYAIIIEAETELPFFAHVLRIAVPIILQYVAPIAGFFGPLGQIAVASLAGLNAGLPLLTGMFGYAGSEKDKEIDDRIINILKPTGILQNVPGLIQLIGQLPGLQHHGEYFKDDIKQAYDHIASFRR